MIPRIIHYCWFGGSQIPSLESRCMKTWTHFQGYKVMRWDETTVQIDQEIPFVQEAYKERKWAFVSDYIRLKALYEYGGIYLDTDVEVKRSFDPLLTNKAFICFENSRDLSTGVIAAEPGNKWIGEMMEMYQNMHFKIDNNTNEITNVLHMSRYTREKYHLNEVGAKQCLMDENGTEVLTVYPRIYFSPFNWEKQVFDPTAETYAIHRFSNSWVSERARRFNRCVKRFSKIFGPKMGVLIAKVIDRIHVFCEKCEENRIE